MRAGRLRHVRSIPAHAGEPGQQYARSNTAKVYPRPRGGASIAHGEELCESGLSPPTRGSRCLARFLSRRGGSIPAHAGEAERAYGPATSRAVYPRPRGGAVASRASSVGEEGLSPPTRGSQSELTVPPRLGRSIPAHAGEPAPRSLPTLPEGVYPRPRGGAILVDPLAILPEGLSPPTRGSRGMERQPPIAGRSIPAHAGEPVNPGDRNTIYEVYPRPRGGAA